SSSENGTISQWVPDSSLQSGGVISIKCIAQQQLPQQLGFRVLSQESVEAICTEPEILSSLSIAIAAATIGGAVALSAVLVAVAAVRISRRSRSRSSPSARLKIYSIVQVNSMMIPYDAQPTDAACCCTEELPECSYLTIIPPGGQAEATTADLQHSASECTEFIEILADGEIEDS
uniref:Ig-like domain-containing protein n=1 Tax=Macrostomum lignano TaxID=282301 RepID=A0A1I8HDT4_9PLAT